MRLSTFKSWRQKKIKILENPSNYSGEKTAKIDFSLKKEKNHALNVTQKLQTLVIKTLRIQWSARIKIWNPDIMSCIGFALTASQIDKPSKLTFWRAFSFSSKFLVAVSSFVWVSVNSVSNWPIFFSSASTSSLAF